MIVEDGKIVEATEDELYKHWLDNFSHIYPFYAYLFAMKKKGVRVIDNQRHYNKYKLRRNNYRITTSISNK